MTNEQIVSRIRNYQDNRLYEQLFKQNEPLIKDICKKYRYYSEMDDLMQEAFIGLIDAVEHYETSENVLFMTFARYWIERQIQQYIINSCSLYRLPQHIYSEKIPQYKRFIKKFETDNNRMPTDKEITYALKIRQSTLEIIQQYMRGYTSLNAPIDADETGEITLQDNIADDMDIANDIVNDMYSEYEQRELWNTVDTYTSEKQARILRYIFINGYSLQRIGDIEGVSRERIRQIREQAFKRLRQTKAQRQLLDKLEITSASIYRSGLNKYKQRANTSVVEYIALKNDEIEEELTAVS